MKNTFLSIACVIGLALCSTWNSFATGNEGVNPPQNGSVTFVATNSVTTAFAFAYATPPVMQLFGSVTNLSPFTNTVTTTNFTLTIAATNATAGGGWGAVGWSAFVGGTREAAATNLLTTATTNFVFPFAYASPPVVIVSGTLTNLQVTAVTITNFTVVNSGGAFATGINWISIGTVFNPPSENVGPNPPSNKVIY
jgi:hypothetical protein